ncbi:MAG: carboxypeptidase regulatory-like domain-containing protein [Planctomycetota bacterium]
MTPTQRNTLLAVAIVFAGGLMGGVWWMLRASPPQTTAPVEAPAPVAAAPAAPEPVVLAGESLAARESDAPALDTTVVFPLEIELELLQAHASAHAGGPTAAAASARLKGSIRSHDQGLRAEIVFVAGANRGRTLATDQSGAFGASDLLPGLSVVQVRGYGVPGSMREVLLRQERDTYLNIQFARLASVFGEVIGVDGTPIPEARVLLDGQETTSDEKGVFYFDRVAPGETLVIVEKPGYAAYRETVHLPGGKTVEKGRLKFTLERGARLTIHVEERLNPSIPAQIFLLPSSPRMQRKFPWFRVNPVSVYPGGTVVVEDLPPEHLSVRLYHPGSFAQPAVRSVKLSPGQQEELTLHLAPAPMLQGTVTRGGTPVSNARVRLEAPDRLGAMLAALDMSSFLELETEVLPELPPAAQETTTDAVGQFFLSANETVSKTRHLIATSPDGNEIGTLTLHGGETKVEVALRPRAVEERTLTVSLEGRHQALPVKITVGGAPRDLVLLAADEDLEIGGLRSGTWQLKARWSGAWITQDQVITIEDDASTSLALPEGAIAGQDDETRKRAASRAGALRR